MGLLPQAVKLDLHSQIGQTVVVSIAITITIPRRLLLGHVLPKTANWIQIKSGFKFELTDADILNPDLFFWC